MSRSIVIKLLAVVLLMGGFAAAQVNLGPNGQIQVKGTLGPTHGGTGQGSGAWVKGDILCGSGADTTSLLVSSTNGYVLTLDSTQPCGFKWASSAGTTIYKECGFDIGANNAGAALVDADISPQITPCQFPSASTVIEIDVRADGGTPNFIVSKNHLGTQTALLSTALATASSGGRACAKTGATTSLDGSTTCSATLQNTSIAAGDYIDITGGTAGGTAKHLNIVIHATVP